jgi:hypothetical protein
MRVAHVELSDLPSALRDVRQYWDGLRGERLAPAWSEIDLVRFPAKVLPTTMIVDIHDPIEKSIFRYWGSKLTEIHGEEMTSRSPYEISPPEFGRQLLADHREIVSKKVPLGWHYSFLAAGGYVHSHSVVHLPLSDDNENVNHIIVVVDYSREALELMKLGRERFLEVAGAPPNEAGL